MRIVLGSPLGTGIRSGLIRFTVQCCQRPSIINQTNALDLSCASTTPLVTLGICPGPDGGFMSAASGKGVVLSMSVTVLLLSLAFPFQGRCSQSKDQLYRE